MGPQPWWMFAVATCFLSCPEPPKCKTGAVAKAGAVAIAGAGARARAVAALVVSAVEGAWWSVWLFGWVLYVTKMYLSRAMQCCYLSVEPACELADPAPYLIVHVQRV
eukprot:scaffold176529_cov27-Tisochrysis_lutea.AAC.1